MMIIDNLEENFFNVFFLINPDFQFHLLDLDNFENHIERFDGISIKNIAAFCLRIIGKILKTFSKRFWRRKI